jgi:hypothetical protein
LRCGGGDARRGLQRVGNYRRNGGRSRESMQSNPRAFFAAQFNGRIRAHVRYRIHCGVEIATPRINRFCVVPAKVEIIGLVHLPEESSHEGTRRRLVNLRGCSDLFDASMVEDSDPVPKRHGLVLVVRYIHRSHPGRLEST